MPISIIRYLNIFQTMSCLAMINHYHAYVWKEHNLAIKILSTHPGHLNMKLNLFPSGLMETHTHHQIQASIVSKQWLNSSFGVRQSSITLLQRECILDWIWVFLVLLSCHGALSSRGCTLLDFIVSLIVAEAIILIEENLKRWGKNSHWSITRKINWL